MDAELNAVLMAPIHAVRDVLLWVLPAVAILVFAVLAFRPGRLKRRGSRRPDSDRSSLAPLFKGRIGEERVYQRLRHLEKEGGKFLFNVYIPKADGETTEIDLLLICPKGLLVFESKNYSGWIFGNAAHKNWTQTLRGRKGRVHKAQFYNPIKQNRTHINHLKRLVGDSLPIWSVIVFSDECELKKVRTSQDASVVNLRDVRSIVEEICDQTPTDLLTPNEILDLYSSLHLYTQVDSEAVKQHEDRLHEKHGR